MSKGFQNPLALRRSPHQTPVGELMLVASAQGLVAVLWPDDERYSIHALRPATSSDILDQSKKQLDAYFAGTLKAFSMPLDLQGTDFQKSVWIKLSEIPFGQTKTYQEQAWALENPGAIRAVAAANGQNPVSIILPCHRVIGSNGKLTGYAGGLDAKRWLLAHEKDNAPAAGLLL